MHNIRWIWFQYSNKGVLRIGLFLSIVAITVQATYGWLKAFDIVSWDFLLYVLGKFGFCRSFLDMVATILGSARISVLINGTSHLAETSRKRYGTLQPQDLDSMVSLLSQWLDMKDDLLYNFECHIFQNQVVYRPAGKTTILLRLSSLGRSPSGNCLNHF